MPPATKASQGWAFLSSFGVEIGPIVLDHVFPAIHPDRIGIVFFVAISVAIDLGDVDEAFVVPFDENFLRPGFLEGVLDVGDQVP